MYSLIVKDGYKSHLSLRETETAIKYIKDSFEKNFSTALGLQRISAPLFVTKKSGLNDDLSGSEKKVSITFKEMNEPSEIVQSLAKWKRHALYKYGFNTHEGLYTDMNAVRRDDRLDNTHSVYVDQWDWEMVIERADRNLDFLKDIVRKIVAAIYDTQKDFYSKNPSFDGLIEKEVYFISSQELESRYPTLSPKERENAITKEKKTVFIMQIGEILNSGKKHDDRAPDYDDWSLNGDIFVWDTVLEQALELSSMGIRVDSKSLKSQLYKSGCLERLEYDYHKKIISETLPLTIGGGIGQSRLCMFILKKLHIGEVQSSVWPKKMLDECKANGIDVL